ncbi:hypothetical protein EUGRSUZ_G02356 [Eucalyptus grandis]|uniref:Uncharacterized protein n=2 Tax=Eucalyptus grandis TaxID=71139 RepID=A0ACC3K684_EUCGR|nr:hypothetical protein EUGRSUZ_G02356 [Eucalyptus grandis]
MTPKLPHALFTMLWLSLLLLCFSSSTGPGPISATYSTSSASAPGPESSPSSPSSSSTFHHRGSINRKVLASKFDFAPFQKRHGKSHRPEPPDDGREIDPRYGMEKRLVPTGPNPLHH